MTTLYSFFEKAQIQNDFLCKINGVEIFLKREDLLHPEVSGNKFRKLKYNLISAREKNLSRILTFGGAYSNHILATAAAGKIFGFETIGVIRGEELGINLEQTLAENPTLRDAAEAGMQLEFFPRKLYREKSSAEVLKLLEEKFGAFYLLPEGGTNELAVKGCEEILSGEDKANYDIICCAVGTGGTISGVINSSAEEQRVLGFPALKGDFLEPEIRRYTWKNNWELITKFHFGGYAKVNAELIAFINSFKCDFGIQLDPVYTGKMMFGIFQMAKAGYFQENTCILAIHTGGLQGISGMNKKLERKNSPLIEV